MTPERWRHVTAVFHDALAHDAPDRAAFLDRACAGDAGVRAEVDRLLAAHQRAGQFGDAPLAPQPGDLLIGAESARSDADDHADEDDGPESGTSGRQRSPFVWVVAFGAVVTIATFGSAAWLMVVQGGATKGFGWVESRRAGTFTVQRVDPTGPAAGRLAVGDRVIALNGAPTVLPGGTGLHRQELSVGDSYRLTVERQGRRLEPTLTVAAGPSDLGVRLTYFVMSLAWCVIGLLIGIARPERPAARLSFGAAVATGLVFGQGAITRALFSLNPLHVVLGFHFFSRFPTDQPLRGFRKAAVALGYAAAALPLALQMWVRVVRETQGTPAAIDLVLAHQSLFALRGPVPLYIFYACLIGMVTMLARNYRALSEEDDRRRVRWVVYVSIAALTPQIVWSVGEFFAGGGTMPWMALPANLATVAIPLVVAYAVVKHRVFDIKVAIRLGVQYLLARRALQTAVVLPAVALAITLFRNRHLTIGELATETSGYLYWLVAAGVTLRFRAPIESWLNRRFFREAHDREHLVLGLLDDVRRVESIAQLSQLVGERLTTALHPSTVYIWYREADDRAAASSSGPLLTPRDVPVGSRWLAWLEQRGAATALPRRADAGLSRDEARWFATHGVTLIVPMMDSSDRLVGAILLGDRKSEEPYTPADTRLLDTIAKQAADVRENLRLRARVSEDARVRHDVLARLDGRLPDLLKECPACGRCFDGPIDRCPDDGRPLTLSQPVGRTLEGKYRLDRLLGKGGMGAVYEARDLRLDRSVAVKILLGRAFGEQAALRRFRHEARAAAQLNHPNVVGVFDFGTIEGDGAYLVMELVSGSTLRAELDRHATLTPPAAAEWFAPLLDGAAAAHASGLVHRDLKPENVIGWRTDSGRLAVKILDLGLVKFTAEGLTSGTMTATGAIMGTPAYMSPEQRRGQDVDHRTDIYAIGVMAVEALTGHRPPAGDSHVDLRHPAGLPLHHLSAASAAIGDVLTRCLAVNPEDRIASAALLRDELIPLLLNCPSLDLAAPGAS